MLIPEPEAIDWLRQHTLLGTLEESTLHLLASALEEQQIPENKRLVLEDQAPTAWWILREGKLESYRTSPDTMARASSLLPGAMVNLTELLLNQVTQRTVITLTACRLWTLSQERLQTLLEQEPSLKESLSRLILEDMTQQLDRLSDEQERQSALKPYLVMRVNRGIVGKSRYATLLRQQIRAAAADRRSVLILGEPGLEKDNAAALIHFGSPWRKEPMIQVNCATLKANGSDLFGRANGQRGLLDWLGTGTLVLNNIQDLAPDLLSAVKTLLVKGVYRPVALSNGALEQVCQARLILISEKSFGELEKTVGHYIKVAPLRVRKTDLAAQVDYYFNLLVRSEGITKPKITPEALRRLQSYDFPGNLAELRSLLGRAVAQNCGGAALTEEIFWPAQARKKQLRFNLLNRYPGLRSFLKSSFWPDGLNFGFTSWVFVLILAVLFLGPQQRADNFALNLFWAWWWPLVLISFPFVGRLWCAVCPFMIWGEIVQKVSLKLYPRTLKKWPRQEAERWGGWFLWALFTLIFLWEELWKLPDTAALSAWLLLLITGGAIVCSLIFERRFWCRYLCPIGGMNGLYAKLAITELRAQQGICSASCTTYQCYKGGPALGEGQETGGCPLYSHPAQLQENRDCVLCMTCLKACPHRSVEVNLRPPGIELWTTHQPRSYEVALLMLLLGGIFLHHLEQLSGWWPWSMANFWSHLGLALVVLVVPTLVILLFHGVLRLWSQEARPLKELAYGYLPLVLGGTLAHYLHLGLAEAGQILPVFQRTFGWVTEPLPVLVAHPAVILFLQGTVLLAAMGLTIWLTQRIARQSLRVLLPQHLSVLLLGGALWNLIVQP